MTELSFLISLLLNDLLPKELKSLVADRIKEVENRIQTLIAPPQVQAISPIAQPHTEEAQAHTHAAAQALAARQQAILNAGKFEPGRTSPRKF